MRNKELTTTDERLKSKKNGGTTIPHSSLLIPDSGLSRLGYHNNYLARLAECVPDTPSFEQIWSERMLIDFKWNTDDGIIHWADAGRVTDMGHAMYASDGSDMRASAPCPFETPEEVWAFDAVKEYGLPDKKDKVLNDIEQTFERLQDCRGAIVAVGNHLPTNIPDEMMEMYFDALLPKLDRH